MVPASTPVAPSAGGGDDSRVSRQATLPNTDCDWKGESKAFGAEVMVPVAAPVAPGATVPSVAVTVILKMPAAVSLVEETTPVSLLTVKPAVAVA